MKGLCGQEIAGQKDSRDRERGRRASRSRLEYLFHAASTEDYDFEVTRIRVLVFCPKTRRQPGKEA